MAVKKIIDEMLPNLWPMITFISVVAISLRGAYLIKNNKKLILHKELLSLLFIVYILCLYYIISYQDINYGGVNLVPFKEMFRYDIGSYKFYKNILGNILIFIPFGFFASHYLNSRKLSLPFIVTLISTLCIETIQYYIGRVFDIDDIILNCVGGIVGYLLFIAMNAIKNRLPRFMKTDGFINFVIIIIIILIILFSFNINVFSYI